MSKLLDQYGNKMRITKNASTMHDGAYPYEGGKPRTYFKTVEFADDYKKNVTCGDWTVLLSKGREIYANVGGVRNAINEISDFAIGDAWLPQYKGEDKEWGKAAEEFLNSWYEICDVRGSTYDLQTQLRNACVAVDRDGDCLMVLTSDQSGKYPKIQWIPAHRIGSRNEDIVSSGPYKGYRIINGVIINDFGNHIAYRVLGDDSTGKDDTFISVYDSHMVFEPDFIDQQRGLTSLATAIAQWDDYRQIVRFEMRGIKHASSFAVQMYVPEEEMDNVSGDDEDNPFVTRMDKPSGNGKLNIETLQGGEVNVWRPDSGAKLEVLDSNRPSANTAQFLLDHCLRHCFLSLRWPVEISYDNNSRGASTKLVISKAQRRIATRQSQVILPVWKRMITYAVAKAAKYGYIPKLPADWYKWEPTYPKEISIENFRDVKSDELLWQKGWMTGQQVAAQYGYDYMSNMRSKVKEIKEVMAMCKEEDIPFEYVLQMTPNMNAPSPEQSNNNTPNNNETPVSQ